MRETTHTSSFSYLDAMDDLRGITVIHGEFVLVTSEGADCGAFAPFSALLARVKNSLAMDVLFVAQALDGLPVPRPIRSGATGRHSCDDAEVDYGHTMLDMARRSRTAGEAQGAQGRLSVAVVAHDSFSYGTLCCRTRGPFATPAEMNALRSLAQMIGHALAERTPGLATLN